MKTNENYGRFLKDDMETLSTFKSMNMNIEKSEKNRTCSRHLKKTRLVILFKKSLIIIFYKQKKQDPFSHSLRFIKRNSK
jgi:hypothetical protein